MCGLKLESQTDMQKMTYVTPFVGVWIETYRFGQKDEVNIVTPFVGVWIETSYQANLGMTNASHPSWVCGLKLKSLHKL